MDNGATKKIDKLAEAIRYKGEIITCVKRRDSAKSERNKQESERINQIKIIEQKRKRENTKNYFRDDVCCGGGVVCVGKNKKCRCDKSKH